jgi:Fic family protein
VITFSCDSSGSAGLIMPIIRMSVQLAKVAQVFITRPGETLTNREIERLTGVHSTTVRIETRKLREIGVLECDTCFDDGHRFKLSETAPLDTL